MDEDLLLPIEALPGMINLAFEFNMLLDAEIELLEKCSDIEKSKDSINYFSSQLAYFVNTYNSWICLNKHTADTSEKFLVLNCLIESAKISLSNLIQLSNYTIH